LLSCDAVKLYIMRHGPAEDAAESRRDFDRALTPSGRERVRDVARLLASEDEGPLLVLSSPLVRALQTAEIVAAVTKLSERGGTVETRRELAAGSSAQGLVRSLVHHKKKRVMLVGHEPDLATLVAQLSGHVVGLGLQKAMVVGLQTRHSGRGEPDEGAEAVADDAVPSMRLRFVLDPQALAFEPDARAT
jgi:phosphohistidine phosphatase